MRFAAPACLTNLPDRIFADPHHDQNRARLPRYHLGRRKSVAAHNRKSRQTSKYAPWRLVTYVAFSDERKAETFERYLKSGSGHAFASKRLW